VQWVGIGHAHEMCRAWLSGPPAAGTVDGDGRGDVDFALVVKQPFGADGYGVQGHQAQQPRRDDHDLASAARAEQRDDRLDERCQL